MPVRIKKHKKNKYELHIYCIK